MELRQIVTDVKLEEEGEWNDHPYFPGVEVCVRSIHSDAWRRRRAQVVNRLPQGADEEVINQAIERAQDVLVAGWRGITNDGEAVDFDPERAAEWSQDRQFRLFYQGVFLLAQKVGRKDMEARETAVGNSATESLSN